MNCLNDENTRKGEFTMRNHSLENATKCYNAGLWGTILAAICCSTPILAIGLGFLGLTALVPYLDRVFIPLSGICLIVAAFGWWRMKQCGEKSNAVKKC